MEKKTAQLLIPCLVAYDALRTLEENDILCSYEGVDTCGRIKMKVDYVDFQRVGIDELMVSMQNNFQDLTTLINLSILVVLNKTQTNGVC